MDCGNKKTFCPTQCRRCGNEFDSRVSDGCVECVIEPQQMEQAMDRGSTAQIEEFHAAVDRALEQADSIRVPSEGQSGWRPTTIEQLRWLNREVLNGRVRVEYRPIESLGSWFAASDCWHATMYDYRIASIGGVS